MGMTQCEIRELKVGRYMMVDDEPCKINNITTSKPGKHGEAKARMEVAGIFDGQKRSIVHPVKHKVKVPMIDKRSAQILAIMGDNVQMMDMTTYETFEMPIPEEFKDAIEPGKEVLYFDVDGRKKITRV